MSEELVKILVDKLVDVAVQNQRGLMAASNQRVVDLEKEVASKNLLIARKEQEIDRLRKLVSEYDAAQIPVTDFYKAVKNLMEARTAPAKAAARPLVMSTMCVVEKHVDLIPF